jgi:hypothetical protein
MSRSLGAEDQRAAMGSLDDAVRIIGGDDPMAITR